MGCNNSNSIQELEGQGQEGQQKENNNEESNKKDDNSAKKEGSEDEKNNENNKKDNNDEKKETQKHEKNEKIEKEKLNINKKNKGNNDNILSTDENNLSNNISNKMTEGIASDNKKKLNLLKQNYEGVILMKGVDELIPEDFNEEDIYQLVTDSLNVNINDEDSKVKVTEKQAKAIASILYNKINKKKEVNMKDYPELNGLNVKIGVQKFTKDVIRSIMFNNDKNVDECQIDLTYINLTKGDKDMKALTIEVSP